MSKRTKILDKNDVNEMAQELKACRDAYSDESEAAGSASLIFTWLGLIGGPAGVCVTAGILTGALGMYYGTVQNTVNKAVDEVDKIKDFFADHNEYDLIEFKVTYITKMVEKVNYWIPTDFEPTRIHAKGSGGWMIM